MTVAIQKAKMIAFTPPLMPKNQPIPKTNFESPQPIQVSLETNDKKAKGKASSGPETRADIVGMCSH